MKKTYDDDFKKQVAKASLESGATLKSVGEEYGVNPTLVRNWRIKFQDDMRLYMNDSTILDSEVERALLGVLDGVMELRENEDDWIFETLDEARDDTFRECEIDEIAEKEEFTSVEEAVESELFSNDQKMRIIKQWVRCIEDLTEVEIGIS
jgi:hypothetical protein